MPEKQSLLTLRILHEFKKGVEKGRLPRRSHLQGEVPVSEIQAGVAPFGELPEKNLIDKKWRDPVGDEHYNKAVFWLTKAANKGHVKANQQLAHVYYWAKEINKAIPCAKFAAKGDNLDAAIILYWAYKDLKQYPEYVEALKAAAELQKKLKKTNIHAPAFEYGKLLLEGEYVPKDLMQSIKWFDVAAKLSYELRQSEKASEYKEKARKEMAKSVLSSINPFKK